MKIKVGTDLVDIKKFTKAAWGKNFLEKIFTPRELINKDVQQLAGMFAAKEAIIKALGLSPGDWLSFEISYSASGRPEAGFFSSQIDKIISCDISISHESGLCLATAIVAV